MKTLTIAIVCLVISCLSDVSRGADSSIEAVKAADAARIAAMQKPDRASLEAIFSDELHYAHSTGTVDTKGSFIDVLLSGKTRYVGYDYESREITFPAPGIALMSGRAHVKAVTDKGEMDSVLSFLSVWRNENGSWRFLAWQSCKVPPPAK